MLGASGKRILLTVHIIFNAIWMGGIFVVFLAVLRGPGSDPAGPAPLDAWVFRIYDSVVMNAGFAVIVTGFLFSLFTRWGFFDFYWIILKWTGLLCLFVIITFALAPAVNGMAALTDLGGSRAFDNPLYATYRTMVLWFSLTLMVITSGLVALSVFKPWGPRKHPFRTKRPAVLTLGLLSGVLVTGIGILQLIQLESFRSQVVHGVDMSDLRNGVYEGQSVLGVTYVVRATVRDHRIVQIVLPDEPQNSYAAVAAGIVERFLREQSPAVKGVTGATTSSKGLMLALENALESPPVRQEQER